MTSRFSSDCLGTYPPYSFERTINRLLAVVLVLLFLPLMAVIALAILVFDRTPVLYRGMRLGRGGRPFVMYKFRTLRHGAEQSVGAGLLRNDDRFVTPVGRILRRFKLDELPQLFNIIRGDMYFVGPRPVRPAMAKEYARTVSNYAGRFAVAPGLTGLAQLRGGYYCPPSRKTRYDLFYIRHRSLALDVKMLMLTGLRLVMSPDCLKAGDRPVGSRLEADGGLVVSPTTAKKSQIAA